jgi:hypothetical protein
MHFDRPTDSPLPPPTRNATRAMKRPRVGRGLIALSLALGLAACATSPSGVVDPKAHLPLLRGWFDGEEVQYVTTDVSDAEVARAKDGNFASRLAQALPQVLRPGEQSAVDKVYAVTNFTQSSVFASAPSPMGHANTDSSYSPLWQLVTVTWRPGHPPRTLKSEEDVLAAAEQGAVTLTATRVVLNCPIVHRGSKGGLPGVSVDPTAPLER